MTCCPTIIGGPVNVTIAGAGIPGGRIKLTTEGSLTVKANTFTISDRDQGLGHTSSRNNSYMEGTFVLSRGAFTSRALFQDSTPGGVSIFDDSVSSISSIKGQCNLVVTLESFCGDTWQMSAAAETSEGEQDIFEGTANFRFSSPLPITEISLQNPNVLNIGTLSDL